VAPARAFRLCVRPGRFDALPQLRALFYSEDAIAWVLGEGRRLPLLDAAR